VPVVAVAESQTVDASGNLSDVYELTYTVPNHPGTFTVSVPKNAQALQAATDAINAGYEQINALYAIP
jgi:hypothetical protein